MIRRNPYNVLGLLAGVPEKEVAKRKAQINAYLNVGKEIAFPEDIPIAVEGLVRTKESVAQAIAEIDQYSKRAVHALYWFTEGGRADGPAHWPPEGWGCGEGQGHLVPGCFGWRADLTVHFELLQLGDATLS
ncbi:MAG: hypothetical protein IPK99_16010 [Flavobacteriales bacterium]|nr:hypothetical protein [Flavobacteriales bacterium]